MNAFDKKEIDYFEIKDVYKNLKKTERRDNNQIMHAQIILI